MNNNILISNIVVNDEHTNNTNTPKNYSITNPIYTNNQATNEPRQTIQQTHQVIKSQYSTKYTNIRKIRSKYIIKLVFNNLTPKKKYTLIQYNKSLQTKLELNLEDYKFLATIMDIVGKFKVQPDIIKYAINDPLFYDKNNQPVPINEINKDEYYLTHIVFATKYFQYIKFTKIYSTRFITYKKYVSLNKSPYFTDNLIIQTKGQPFITMMNNTNHKRVINHLTILPYKNCELSVIFEFKTTTLLIEELNINNIQSFHASLKDIKFIRQINTNQIEIVQNLIEAHIACSITYIQDCKTQDQYEQIEKVIQSLNFSDYRHHIFNVNHSIELHIVKDNDPYSI
jgi:hypothetical protein